MKDGSAKTGLMSAGIININNEDCILSITRDISERRRLQAIVEQNEEKYRFLVESVHAISWEFDIMHDQWTYVSPQAEKLLGYKPEEWTNLEFWTQKIHPDEREWASNYCFECTAKGESHLFEYRFKNKEGNYVWLRDIVSVEMHDQKPHKLRGVMFDITDQKEIEQALRHNDEKLKEAQRIAHLGNWELNHSDNKLVWSEETYNIFEIKNRKKEMDYDSFLKFIHPDDQKSVNKAFTDSLKNRLPYEIIHQIITDKGNVKYVKEKCKTTFNKSGKPLKSTGIIQDITDYKKVELDLRKAKVRAEESQNYSKIIAELSKKVIKPELSVEEIGDLIYQQALTLTSSNYGYVGTIDLETEELVSHTMKEMMPNLCNVKEKRITFPKGKDGYKGLYGHALNTFEAFFTNNPAGHEASKGLPDGHVAITNLLTVPVVVNNILLGQIALANKPTPYDITDLEKIKDLANVYGIAVYRKNMEGDLIKSKEKAEESERLKSAFLANMSHEIRTPMNSILGFSELFRMAKITNEKKEHYMNIIHSSGRHLVKIIDDIIDFSKIESGQLIINRSNINLKELFGIIYNEFSQQIESQENELKLILDIPDDDYIIYSDDMRLKQIMINFLSNSIKFTEKGEIVFGYKKAGKNKLKFFVKDTGIGIPEEKLETIFERFRQADDSTTRKYGGTGLGLAISKNLVELLNGEIGVRSEENSGAEFFFTLPL